MKRFLRKIAAIANHRSSGRSSLNGDRRSRISQPKRLVKGFTLIELLVASLIASLMVVVMLGFLVGVLDSDRKETVKSNAQEELQAAIAYISDDLQEAMYIYGAEGLAGINAELPHSQSGAGNQCNPDGVNTCTPVLVFWKRNSFAPNSQVGGQILGCMPYRVGSTEATNCASTNATINPYQTAFGREIYSFSLVAYYLKNDTANPENSGWSNTARILRWELSDGYPWYCSTGGPITDITNCPTNLAVNRNGAAPGPVTSLLITVPTPLVDSNNYFIPPDPGFNRPDFSSAASILSWRKFANYNFGTNQFVTLVDFMDDTAYAANQGGNNDAGTASGATAAIRIPIGRNVTISGNLTNPDCDDPSIGVGNVSPVTVSNPSGTVTQRVPADFNAGSGLSSFYMCVAPNNVTTRIFLRGNAIARLTTPAGNRALRQPTETNITFFPTADVRSFGRSQIGLGR